MTEKVSTGLSTVLIVIAVAMVAGFLLWLYRSARTLEDQVTPEMVEGEPALDLVALSANPAASVGMSADIEAVAVLRRLGRGVFVVQLVPAEEGAQGVAFPVLLSADLIGRGTQIYGGDVVRLFGRVYSLNDSIRGQWVSAGAVEAAAAENIPQTRSFLLADSAEAQ